MSILFVVTQKTCKEKLVVKCSLIYWKMKMWKLVAKSKCINTLIFIEDD